MKLVAISILFEILFFSNIFSQNQFDLNCFTIVVGKNASSDGSVLVAHNEDDNGKQIVNLYKIPQIEHKENEFIELCNGGKINQVKKTNGFIWIELPGMKVADSFINDKSVVIVSNGCPSKEDNPDSTNGGILYWLRRLVAERAKSAKDGVKIAGSLIDKFGYVSSGRTYTFADKNEAWVLSAVYGKHWIAQRVPDDEIAVIPNYYTIGKIDLKDTVNFLGSYDIISYAILKDWFNPSDDNEFNFAKSYTAETSINHPGNIHRIWRGISLLSKNHFSIENDFPFSFEPYKKIQVQDLMEILRDHYEGCNLDASNFYKNGNPHQKNHATICSEFTQYSFIAKLNQDIPEEFGDLIWLSYYRPDINIFIPFYSGLISLPKEFAIYDYELAMKLHFNPSDSTFKMNSNHVYWDFVNAVNFVENDYYNLYPKIKNRNHFIENEIFKVHKEFEEKIITLFKINPKLTLNLINDYSNQNLLKLRNCAREINKFNFN
ncbi:MAG: C69 family dipeptidase [Ignavibacteriae bacterium]|nr:C69 family dipeptidase [Ignavibacteriota bacterium]